jgi:hypothetical protein
MKTADVASTMIAVIVQDAIAGGNAIAEISEGWSRMEQVVYMRDPRTDSSFS